MELRGYISGCYQYMEAVSYSHAHFKSKDPFQAATGLYYLIMVPEVWVPIYITSEEESINATEEKSEHI